MMRAQRTFTIIISACSALAMARASLGGMMPRLLPLSSMRRTRSKPRFKMASFDDDMYDSYEQSESTSRRNPDAFLLDDQSSRGQLRSFEGRAPRSFLSPLLVAVIYACHKIWCAAGGSSKQPRASASEQTKPQAER